MEAGDERSRSRSVLLLPLIALSAVLAVLIAAIVIVMSRRPDPANQPDNSAAGCLIGAWLVRSHLEKASIERVGEVEFNGSGHRWTFSGDGTGVADYGRPGTAFEGNANGHRITLTVAGEVTFDFRTEGQTLTFADVRSAGRTIVELDGVRQGDASFTANQQAARYTCTGDTLRIEVDGRYETDMARTS